MPWFDSEYVEGPFNSIKEDKMDFKFLAQTGMDEAEIKADSITLILSDGQNFELCPRKSDGVVGLYSKRRLSIQPRAANLVHIFDIGEG